MFADTVIYSKNVYTGNKYNTEQLAIGIKDDEIIFTGTYEQAHKYIDEFTKILNFNDKFICPGFHDNHIHFVMSSMVSSRFIADCSGSSAEECIAKMKAVEDIRDKDKFMLGFGWYHMDWENPVLPTKEMIDAIYPDRPVAMQSIDAHTMWLNSCALDKLGITKDTPPPQGGTFVKDESGELTGITQETASLGLMQKIFDYSYDEYCEAFDMFLHHLAECGITSACDMAALSIPGGDLVMEDLYDKYHKDKELTCRLNIYPQGIMDLTRAHGVMDKHSTNKYIRFSGFKQFFDGINPTHTAWLGAPYKNAFYDNDCGNPSMDPSLMRDIILNANKEGISVRVHAVGDKSVDTLCDIFEEAQSKYGLPKYGRNGIEHIDDGQPYNLKRMADLGLVANGQPPHLVYDMFTINEYLDDKRANFAWAFKSWLEAGAVTSFGTDCPVVDVDFRNVLFTAVARRDANTLEPEGGWLPQFRVSRQHAIDCYTQGSAYSCGREEELGTIEVGKLADIVVLDTNLLECSEEDILKANVLQTIVGGKTVYKA